MQRIRTVLFWIHLSAGVLGGLVIFVMSFTGVVLALKPQILAFVDRDVRTVTAREQPRLSAGALFDAVAVARPGATPASLTIEREPTSAAAVGLGREGTIYLDPYDGRVLGAASARANAFFQSMTTWHRYMGAGGELRSVGRSATGASNLAFFFLAVSGLYMWWPRRLSAQHMKPILWFRQSATGRARDFNWHNVIGFWCLPAIIVMTISGTVMSYSWANDLLYTLTGSPLPRRGPAGGGPGAAPAADPLARGGQHVAIPDAIDAIWARAEAQTPSWSVLAMRLPERTGAPVSFTVTDGNHWNAFARSQLSLASSDGAIVQWQPYEASSAGQKLRGWLRFAHTGELAGLPGQLIAGLGCLGGMALVYTGWALACRRLWSWARRWGRREALGWEAANS
jgi:uncharacterized iron-regulated membrane protein